MLRFETLNVIEISGNTFVCASGSLELQSPEILIFYYNLQIEEPLEVLEETTTNDITDYADWSTFGGECLSINFIVCFYTTLI